MKLHRYFYYSFLFLIYLQFSTGEGFTHNKVKHLCWKLYKVHTGTNDLKLIRQMLEKNDEALHEMLTLENIYLWLATLSSPHPHLGHKCIYSSMYFPLYQALWYYLCLTTHVVNSYIAPYFNFF